MTRKDASAVSIRMAGEVIGSTIQADVASAPATGQRLTYIANPFPVASRTLAQSGLYTGNSSTGVAGGTSSSAADTVTIYDPNSGAALVYYYNTTQGKWLRGATDSSNVTIPEGAAVVITRKNGRPAFDWYIPSPVNLNL